MRRIETYELIERYLLGRLNPDEKAEMETRIKNDPSFANQVEQHRGMQQVINDYSVLDVKDILSRIRDRKQISIRKRNKFYRSMLIVGSCAIIVSLSLLYFFSNNDSAVRRASEAPGASEALTDALVPAGEKEEITEDQGPSEESIQSGDRSQTEKSAGLPDGKIKSEKDDAVKDLPMEQADSSALRASPIAATKAAPDLKSGTSGTSQDLQSGEEHKADDTSKPCKIKAGYSTEPSCNNKATGVIRIIKSTLITGTPPYQAVLNGEYSDSLVFRGLKPGFYRLEIKDAAGCLVSLGTVMVGTKDCTYQDKFYAPLELWEIPLEDSQLGTIEIRNKNGLIVYRLRFDGTGREYWNGNDMNNEALPLGAYFFTIRYDNGEVFLGSVTINR